TDPFTPHGTRSENKDAPALTRKVKGFLQAAFVPRSVDCDCNELVKEICHRKSEDRFYSPPAFRQRIAVVPMNIFEGWGAHPVSTVTHLYSLRGVPQRGRCKHRNVILTVCIRFSGRGL